MAAGDKYLEYRKQKESLEQAQVFDVNQEGSKYILDRLQREYNKALSGAGQAAAEPSPTSALNVRRNVLEREEILDKIASESNPMERMRLMQKTKLPNATDVAWDTFDTVHSLTSKIPLIKNIGKEKREYIEKSKADSRQFIVEKAESRKRQAQIAEREKEAEQKKAKELFDKIAWGLPSATPFERVTYLINQSKKPKPTIEQRISAERLKQHDHKIKEGTTLPIRELKVDKKVSAIDDVLKPALMGGSKSLGVDFLSKQITSMFDFDDEGNLKLADKATRKENRKEYERTKNELYGIASNKEGLSSIISGTSETAGKLITDIFIFNAGIAIVEGIPAIANTINAIKSPIMRTIAREVIPKTILNTVLKAPGIISEGIDDEKSALDITKEIGKSVAIDAAISLAFSVIKNNKAIRQGIKDFNAKRIMDKELRKILEEESGKAVLDAFGNKIGEDGFTRNAMGDIIDPNTGEIVDAFDLKTRPDDFKITPPMESSLDGVQAPATAVVPTSDTLPIPEGASAVNALETAIPEKQVSDVVEAVPPEGMKTRKLVNTILKRDETPYNVKEAISKDDRAFYRQFTNKAALEEGTKIVNENINTGVDPVAAVIEKLNTEQPSAVLVAEGFAANKALEDAISKSTSAQITKELEKQAQELSLLMAQKGTESGQFVQALGFFKTVTGENYNSFVEKQIDLINNEGVKRFGVKRWKPVTITDEIKKLMTARGNVEAAKRYIFDDEILNQIGNMLPATAFEQVSAFRHLAMLSNPKTHARNIIGNVASVAAAKPKDGLAQLMEKFIPQEERTKAIFWRGDKELVKTVDEAVPRLFEQLAGGKYEQSVLNKVNRDVFTAGHLNPNIVRRGLQKTMNFIYGALGKEDDIFVNYGLKEYLGQFMKARGLTTVTKEAEEYAMAMAERITFHTDTALSRWLSDANKHSKLIGAGIDTVLPFKKTPINLAVEVGRYSPGGAVKAVFIDIGKMRRGEKTAAEFIDQLAAGLTGTGVISLGFILYNLGIITGAPNKNKNIAAFEKAAGKQAFAINVGNKYLSYDWAEPAGAWLAAGASIGDVMKGDANFFDAMTTGTTAMVDALFNSTVLSRVRDALASPYERSVSEAFVNIGADYLLSFVPTIVSSAAQVIDDTVRTTKYKQSSIPGAKTAATAASKIPGLSFTQQPLMNIKGEPTKRDSNILMRSVQSFLSPSFISTYKVDDTDKEILEVYEHTGKTDVFPKVAPKSFVHNKVTYTLTAEEATKFQETMGQATYKRLNSVINSKFYSGYNYETKAKIFRNAADDGYQKAKTEVLKGRGIL